MIWLKYDKKFPLTKYTLKLKYINKEKNQLYELIFAY